MKYRIFIVLVDVVLVGMFFLYLVEFIDDGLLFVEFIIVIKVILRFIRK